VNEWAGYSRIETNSSKEYFPQIDEGKANEKPPIWTLAVFVVNPG
jgi:hypothetical protein